MPIYDEPVRLLMRRMAEAMNLTRDDVVDRSEVVAWFKANYPLVKEGTVTAHLTRMSVNAPSRLHHSLAPDGSDDLFFQLDRSRFRLYRADTDPPPIRSSADVPDEVGEEPDEGEIGSSEFAYERDLRDYLAKNLGLLEPGLRLYSEEGVRGIEFPVGGRFVDILAVDSSDRYVVIELKVSKGYDRVIGQLLRYKAWIEKNHAETGQQVRGFIVAKTISEDLQLACSGLDGVELFEYELSVTVEKVG